MPIGSYNAPTDFTPFVVKGFPFTLFNHLHAGAGCGQTALALLTGVEPRNLGFKYRERIGDDEMRDCLFNYGFSTIPITKCDVSRDHNLISSHIYADHVLLISCLCARNDTTWMVLYDGYMIHNFQIDRMNALEFLNNPLRTAYVVWHPKWIRQPPEE